MSKHEKEAAEARIAEAEAQESYRERFEHIREAHRQQALDVVAKQSYVRKLEEENHKLTKELADQREMAHRSDIEWGEELEEVKKDFDELFREYAKVSTVLAHLVDLEHAGEITFHRSLTQLGLMIRASEDGQVKVRAIVLQEPAFEKVEDEH